MENDRTDRRQKLTAVSLVLTVITAILLSTYYFIQGESVIAILILLLVLVGGIWEYRQKLLDVKHLIDTESEQR